MRALMDDFRYSIRLYWKSPGFTAVALLTLMLGIAGNTAIFSIVNASLIKWGEQLKDPDRLVMVWKFRQDSGLWMTTPADFRDWRDQNRVFEKIGAYSYANFNLTGDGEPEKILGANITANLFPLLGTGPALGRSFSAKEEEWGNNRSVILSHGLWKRRFGGDSNISGRTLQLNGETYTVVGVMPPGAWFASTQAELWVPFAFASDDPGNTRRSHFVFAVARLGSNVSLEQARAEMKSIAREIEKNHPENRGLGAEVTVMRDTILGNVRPMLFILLAAVGFVLLIACANVANLLLARSVHRKRELAIRLSIGASRGRLIRQLLVESTLLGALGGALGLALSNACIHLLLGFIPVNIPRIHEIAISVDVRVFFFTAVLSVITGILFGLVPALQASNVNMTESLKEGGRSAGSLRGKNFRNVLIVSEIALALVLSAGAGLMIRSLMRIQETDIGVQPGNVLTMQVELPEARENDPAQVVSFYDQVLERVASLPGVVSAGVTSHLPLGGGGQSKYFHVDGDPLASSLREVGLVSLRQESHESFSALRMQLLKGRSFTKRDSRESPRVAIINETLARRFFADKNPIGKRFSLEWPEHLAPPDSLPENGRFPRWTIIGIVRDVRYQSWNEPVELAVYIPYTQRDAQNMSWAPSFLIVRTKNEPLSLAAAVRDQIRAVDRNQPISKILTLQQVIQTSFKQSSFTMILFSVFAALALLLAALGIYGVMSFLVAQRRNEIGLRKALGANDRDVLKLVLKQGLVLTFIGVGIGLLASFALTRLMSSLLFGVSATDPSTFLLIPLILIAVTLFACYAPARSASKVDPIVALRYE